MSPNNEQPAENLQVKPEITHQEEEKFTMLMRQIESGTHDNMSPEQIDKLLEQRGKVHDYIHEENMQSHERFKIGNRTILFTLAAILFFALGIIILVAFTQKDQLITLIDKILFFMGGIGFGKVVKIPGRDKPDNA